MEFTFNIKGHENITAIHRATLEFTKKKDMTKKASCIIGVEVDFDYDKLKDFILENKYKKIIVEINSNRKKDSFVCFLNRNFKSKEEIVIRKSRFVSDRTLALKASKSSNELKRNLIDSIKINNTEVIMRPVRHKCIIFDFDNTLEEFEYSKSCGEKAVAEAIAKKFNKTFNNKENIKGIKKSLTEIDYEYTVKGMAERNPELYSRVLWFKEYAKRNKLHISEKDIKKLVDLYWAAINKKLTAIAGAHQVLQELKDMGYILVLLTDSDGKREIKIKRIKNLKLEKYFDLIVTGDDTKTTKPDIKNYKYILEKLNKKMKELKKEDLRCENFIAIGDRPAADHINAKPLGITTVWFKYGLWKKIVKEAPYVDFEINKLKDIIYILKRLDG